jgi:hypothetical protein
MAQQLPLDVVSTSTCYGAYAVYRVSSSYVGATVNVRRSSDNVATDFYANAYGQLGTSLNGTGTSIETWLGSSTGYVVTWYDQSGSGNHATQSNTTLQPRVDNINNRIDFTVSSGTAHLLLPSGTVPNCRTYSVSGYISTNSAARTILVSNNNILQNIYDNALTATVIMNGGAIGFNATTSYLPGSRTDISLTNEFSILYSFFDGTYTKAAQITYRQNGSTIDCYQSAAMYWIGNYTGQYYPTISSSALPNGSGPSVYGVLSVSIVYKTSYTVTVKHNTIGNTNGTWLGAAGTGAGTNTINEFRRDSTGYLNAWYAYDFNGNLNTYAAGNIVTYTYDGNYIYLYINGTPQGVSALRTGWNGQSGNEYIGRSHFGEYLNGELYSLFIFKSLLSTSERTSIEKTMPLSNASGPISFSKLKTALGLTTSSVSMSQAKIYAGAGSALAVSKFDGYTLRNGLFMRFYSNTYFYNNVNFFNSNTPSYTGVVTNFRNTYCATGGISNATPAAYQIGNVPVMSTYSVEWFGVFFAPVSGTYTFYITSDDTSFIWIGDNALSGYTTTNTLINTLYVYTEISATISLTGGTYYPFRFQYGAGGGDALFFSFAPPNGGRVYDGTGYYFCQSINNPNNTSLSVYYPFEIPDSNLSIVKARYVGFDFGNVTGGNRYINVVGVSVFTSSNGSNIINTSMTVTASSFGTAASPLIDNNDSTLFYTAGSEISPYVIIDLGSEQTIYKVQLHNRQDCCSERIAGGRLFLRDGNNSTFYTSNLISTKSGSTTYADGNNGYFFYTWWPGINTIPYSSDTVPYPYNPFSTNKARYIGFDYGNTTGGGRYINVVGVSVFTSSTGSNIINSSMTINASSIAFGADALTDNNDSTLFHTNPDINPYVIVDLGSEQYIHKVQLHNRQDCCTGRIAGGRLFLRDANNVTFYTSNIIATKGGLTTYQDYPTNDGHLFYTWWPSANTTPYGSDTVPYPNNPFTPVVTNKANSSSNLTLYNGATLSNTVFKQGSSSLSLTATSSQYALSSKFTPTTNGLTIAFWYKSNGSGTWARVFDFGNGAANDNIFISSNGDGGNRFAFSVFYGSTENKIYFTDINYNDNVWRHIVWTLTYATPNSYTSTWNLYVNGVNKYNSSTQLYPSSSVTRTLCYLGRSNWAGHAYYNGNIDEFRIYDSVLSATDAAALYNNTMVDYTYTMLNGSTSITTTVQGMSSTNPATSGYAIYSANPWLPNGYYWIKSAAMPNALQMFVDIKNGGQDFYQIVGGTNVNYITQTHSGTALGLELVIPRSQDSWRAIYNYVHTTLGSNYPAWYTIMPIYKTSNGGDYTGYAMFDPRFGNSGSTAGSYNGAPDWRCKDGGLWYIKDIPYGSPSGDYYANAFMNVYSEILYPQWLTSYGSSGFNDSNDTYYTGSTYLVSTNYAGSTLTTLYNYFDGSTAARAAPSALYIKNLTGTTTNGVYWINLPTVGATQVYCIMDSAVDGGGWMMAMKATRGTTFNYDSTHWTTATTLNPSDNTRNDADAKFHSMNYFQGKDLLALWPDIPYNYGGGTGGSLSLPTYNNWCWMKNNYNSGSRQALINYFSIVNNVEFIPINTPAVKGAERGTVFSSQGGTPSRAFYGINFTINGTWRVRWGFAYNENDNWLSNDVTGGIGLAVTSYSAGDYIQCCQDQTGINRSARVEVYVR